MSFVAVSYTHLDVYKRQVYAAVASSVIWHELGNLAEDERGLMHFLEGTLRRLVSPYGLELDDTGAAELPEERALLQTLATTSIDSLSFHKAVQGFLYALCLLYTSLPTLEQVPGHAVLGFGTIRSIW